MKYKFGDKVKFTYANAERVGFILEVDTIEKLYTIVTNVRNLVRVPENKLEEAW